MNIKSIILHNTIVSPFSSQVTGQTHLDQQKQPGVKLHIEDQFLYIEHVGNTVATHISNVKSLVFDQGTTIETLFPTEKKLKAAK